MARRQRFHLPSATYHVMLRGNDGQPIFFSEGDRSRMCLLIQEGVERFGHSIHAFCFMTNHIHLAVKVADVSISRIMQHLAFRYTRYINRQQRRVGHLFQGRFKSILVDDELYLKELVRYIHLNPVRSGIVIHPDKYLWSSHRAYMQLEELVWLNQNRLLKSFDHNLEDALSRYEKYILKGIGIEIELNFKSGCIDGILGDKEFVEEVVERVYVTKMRKIELSDLIAKICEQYSLTEEDLCKPGKHPKPSQARAMLALLVRELDNISLESLAHFLKREASGLSKLANRLQSKCCKTNTMGKEVEEMRRWIIARE
jgi:putative transposase